MKLSWCVILFIFLWGCGSSPTDTPAVGLVNQTRHSDAELWAIWTEAQQSVTTQIDLNPLQQSTGGASADLLPGDPRAGQVMPQQLTVAPAPDVSSQVLFAVTGTHRADPTGMIACPAPCNVRYAAAYSIYRPEITKYAASWEFAGNSFKTILEYEFENQILFALGYDMRWR